MKKESKKEGVQREAIYIKSAFILLNTEVNKETELVYDTSEYEGPRITYNEPWLI